MRAIDKSQPNLSLQLADALREAILGGEYSSGQSLPSERELCEQTGLSRTTVRRALETLAAEGLVVRVPGAGSYVGTVPTKARSADASIGLIVPTLANPYYGELSEAVEQEAQSRGFNLLLGQSDYVPNNEAAYLRRYADTPSVKGILVVPNLDNTPFAAYSYLEERGLPFVFLARWTEDINADAVAVDGQRGTREAVRHLISLGHRRIAYIQGGPRRPDVRLRGYQQALAEAGIPEDRDLIVLQDAPSERVGLDGIRLLLQRGIVFTSVFARNDICAMGVLQGLAEAGLRVPDDVSVVGFDNIQISAHVQPPLTTVDHPVREIARMGMLLLMERVERRYDGPPRRVSVQPRLVIRQSCAPPAERSAQTQPS